MFSQAQFFVLVVSFLAVITQSKTSENPRTFLKDGTEIIGSFEEFSIDLLPAMGKVESYYGIPYSEPPIGALRFKPPVAKGKLDSPFHASEFGRSCMQVPPEVSGLPLGNAQLSEDCLFLDVITPHPKPTDAPVYVMIHGGGFVVGAGNMPSYANWSLPALYGDIIVVTMNYRLGPFGFLTTGDDVIPGNLGLLDQQLALKWVQENIKAFGGDPKSVTIGGVSAGSVAAGFHVLSPGSRGLFKGAILQSGSPFDVTNMDRSREIVRNDVQMLAEMLECSEDKMADDAELLGCLQRVPAEDIIEKSNKIGDSLGDPTRLPPGPITDGHFLPETPVALIEGGKLNGESLMVGTNADEGTLFLFFLFPDKDVKPVIDSSIFAAATSVMGIDMLDPGLVDLVRALYTPDTSALLDETREDFFEEAVSYLGDKVFMCPNSKFARLASETVDVYRYTMTYVPSVDFMDLKWAGAGHGNEGQFFIGRVFEDGYADRTRAEEKDMSRMALNYWLNFIKTGNPNTAEGGDGAVELPEWPKFTKEDQLFKDLTPEMKNIYFRQQECYFHENIFPNLKKSFAELRELQGQWEDEKVKWTKEGQCTDGSCHGDDAENP